jgi:Flp pilus assembly pilin Flp
MSDILVEFYHDARGGIGFQYGLAVMAVAVAVVEAVRLMGIDVGDAIDTLTSTLR